MQTFEGIIRVRQVNPGSKSEGAAAWLETDAAGELKMLRLYRSDMPDVGDSFFAEMDGKHVVIGGEAEAADYLRVAEMNVCQDPVRQKSVRKKTVNKQRK